MNYWRDLFDLLPSPLVQSRHQEGIMSRIAYPRFGPRVEQLEAREVPAIISYSVNTTDDTAFAKTVIVNGQTIPVDANGNTSLRAVVDYANQNPERGDPSENNYQVDLGAIAGRRSPSTPPTTIPPRSSWTRTSTSTPPVKSLP